jgi:hypothetical protein
MRVHFFALATRRDVESRLSPGAKVAEARLIAPENRKNITPREQLHKERGATSRRPPTENTWHN